MKEFLIMLYFKNICLIRVSFLILTFLIGLNAILFAKPPLWEAMDAYERDDLETARILFRGVKNSPIARPYLIALELKKASEFEDLSDYEIDKFAKGWFEVSKILRRISQFTQQMAAESKAKKKKTLLTKRKNVIVNELMKLSGGVAHYALGQLIDQGVVLTGQLSSKTAAANYYSSSFQQKTVMDVRALLKLVENRANITSRGVDIARTIPILRRYLEIENADVGEAIFRFAGLFNTPGASFFNSDFYIKLVRCAALYGSVEAQFETAKNYSDSIPECFYWFMQAAQQGDRRSQAQVAQMLEEGQGCKIDPQKCLKYSQLSVESLVEDSPTAYFNHANRLRRGIGTTPDIEKAEEYYKQAVDSGGDDDMVWEYGRCLRDRGKLEEARKVWEPLALKGHLNALQDFAAICQNPQDYLHLLPICLEKAKTDDHALRLVTQLVCQSKTQSINLEELYNLLERFEKNSTKEDRIFGYLYRAALLLYLNESGHLRGDAVELLKKAVILGSNEAAFELGECYLVGRAVEPNSDQALNYFKIAAKGGIEVAHQKIGYILMERHDPSVDAEAIEHFRKASNIPSELHYFAKFNLAIMLLDQRGGSTRDYPVITQLLEDCLNHPEIRVDALYHLAKCELLKMRDDKTNKDLNAQKALQLIEEGFRGGHLPSLFLRGCLLIQESDSNSSQQREGFDNMRCAAEAGFSSAKMVYAYLSIMGVEGLLERSIESTIEQLSRFTPNEKNLFYGILEKMIPPEYSEQHSDSEELSSEKKEDSSLANSETVSTSEEHIQVNEEGPETPKEWKKKERKREKERGKVIKKEGQVLIPASIDPRLARLLGRLEEYKGKKQVKWLKFKNFMHEVMAVTSGGFTPGKGSGLHVKIAGLASGLHIPHGPRNASEISGGRLEDMRRLLEEVLRGQMNSAQTVALLRESSQEVSQASSSTSEKTKKKNKKGGKKG